MTKKKLNVFLLSPLFVLCAFNLFFIVLSLKGEMLLARGKSILMDYFVGFPLVPLFLVVIVIVFRYFRKKISFFSLGRSLIFVILIYMTSINLAFFHEFNSQQYWSGDWNFIWKKTDSIEEAIDNSPSKYSSTAKIYLRMGNILNICSLIIPTDGPITEDYFFWTFVHPKKIIYKDYQYNISGDDFKALQRYRMKTFSIKASLANIDRYIIINPGSDSKVYHLLIANRKLLFVPSHVLAAMKIGRIQ